MQFSIITEDIFESLESFQTSHDPIPTSVNDTKRGLTISNIKESFA